MFGRTGQIEAAEGDYALTQLSDVDGKHGSGRTVQMYAGGASEGDCAAFDASGNLTGAGAPCSTSALQAGTGIAVVATSPRTISVNSATVPTFLTAKVTTGTIEISPLACSEWALPLAGAGLDDAVAPGWPASLPAGVVGHMRVTGAAVVGVRLCNITAVRVTVPAATYRATVVRSF